MLREYSMSQRECSRLAVLAVQTAGCYRHVIVALVQNWAASFFFDMMLRAVRCSGVRWGVGPGF